MDNEFMIGVWRLLLYMQLHTPAKIICRTMNIFCRQVQVSVFLESRYQFCWNSGIKISGIQISGLLE